MRKKFPQILCFDEWVELYKLPDEYALGTLDKTHRFYTGQLSENKQLKEARNKVLEVMEQNKELVKNIELAMVVYNQLFTAKYPPVYLAYLKDTKTDLEYLTAKTFWPLMDGKKKEIRIYIGSKKEFPDHNNQKVRWIAAQKMREHLKSKLLDLDQPELF